MADVTPPPCAWCSDPATEQVYVGTRLTGSKPRNPLRLYAWLCDECARLDADERQRSVQQ